MSNKIASLISLAWSQDLIKRIGDLSVTQYKRKRVITYTVEPRFNEPLYSEALGITNDIFQPSNSVMYGKEPRYNEPSI